MKTFYAGLNFPSFKFFLELIGKDWYLFQNDRAIVNNDGKHYI